MTRDEWLAEVVRPWRAGDIVQFRHDDASWSDCFIDRDPMGIVPVSGGEYRIKPRTVKWVVELPTLALFDFKSLAKSMVHCSAEFIYAIRQAKPLEEVKDEN